jgi:hypothetical protein
VTIDSVGAVLLIPLVTVHERSSVRFAPGVPTCLTSHVVDG